jgi:leucyl aminopeptidase (aminopeptidase T)
VSEDDIAQEIVRQLSRRAADSSICPSEVARALLNDEVAWRALMPQVREVAATMRDAARLRITRGGVDLPIDAQHRGAIRLARGPDFDA